MIWAFDDAHKPRTMRHQKNLLAGISLVRAVARSVLKWRRRICSVGRNGAYISKMAYKNLPFFRLTCKNRQHMYNYCRSNFTVKLKQIFVPFRVTMFRI